MSGAELSVAVRADLEPRRHEMVDLLGDLVRIESPSDDRPSLDRFAARLQTLFGELGDLERIEPGDPVRGSHLRLTVGAQNGSRQHAVALCHYDTVWSLGTLQRIPFSVDDGGVARGPGCFDMKGGIVVLYFALQALRARGLRPARPLRVLFTSDEEVGSPTSRPLIERTADGAAVAYILESPLPGGTLKTARKGTGDFFVRITGRAAHAGVEPQ
ncbi:MAG TPA: M20/M25/M40 family metallo-hydrolase, partial [Chloroflexota bacterium]